ncbi:hypothetical protein PENSPDRAFT_734929 [Peniophora sp. CONT]|nr:hypothetical protein PENSPDRAFT_734929 [Peniophora sp. CONT]
MAAVEADHVFLDINGARHSLKSYNQRLDVRRGGVIELVTSSKDGNDDIIAHDDNVLLSIQLHHLKKGTTIASFTFSLKAGRLIVRVPFPSNTWPGLSVCGDTHKMQYVHLETTAHTIRIDKDYNSLYMEEHYLRYLETGGSVELTREFLFDGTVTDWKRSCVPSFAIVKAGDTHETAINLTEANNILWPSVIRDFLIAVSTDPSRKVPGTTTLSEATSWGESVVTLVEL